MANTQRARSDRDRGSMLRSEPKRVEWDKEWGGDCPWREPDPEMEALRRKARLIVDKHGRTVDVWEHPPLIDRLIPYILIIGFFAFLFGLYGLLDWFLFTVVPGWFA